MSSQHNTNPDTNGATAPVSTDAFQFASGALVTQIPFRVHGKAGSLIDRFARKYGIESKTEYVRRVVYQKLAEELEEEARELRAAVS